MQTPGRTNEEKLRFFLADEQKRRIFAVENARVA